MFTSDEASINTAIVTAAKAAFEHDYRAELASVMIGAIERDRSLTPTTLDAKRRIWVLNHTEDSSLTRGSIDTATAIIASDSGDRVHERIHDKIVYYLTIGTVAAFKAANDLLGHPINGIRVSRENMSPEDRKKLVGRKPLPHPDRETVARYLGEDTLNAALAAGREAIDSMMEADTKAAARAVELDLHPADLEPGNSL